MLKNRIIAVAVFVMVLLTVACGSPTYVTQAPYDPNQQVVQQQYVQPVAVDPIYDATLALILLNGQRGYYDHYHHFHTTVIVNGYNGYYDDNHRFVSNAPEVRVAVQSHKPLYVTPPQSASVSGSNLAKPQYNQGPGTASRGPATAPVTAKPQYNQGPGTASRGPATSTTTASKPSYGSPVASKPSYGSSAPSRSVSSPSKPSYGSKH